MHAGFPFLTPLAPANSSLQGLSSTQKEFALVFNLSRVAFTVFWLSILTTGESSDHFRHKASWECIQFGCKPWERFSKVSLGLQTWPVQKRATITWALVANAKPLLQRQSLHWPRLPSPETPLIPCAMLADALFHLGVRMLSRTWQYILALGCTVANCGSHCTSLTVLQEVLHVTWPHQGPQVHSKSYCARISEFHLQPKTKLWGTNAFPSESLEGELTQSKPGMTGKRILSLDHQVRKVYYIHTNQLAALSRLTLQYHCLWFSEHHILCEHSERSKMRTKSPWHHDLGCHLGLESRLWVTACCFCPHC